MGIRFPCAAEVRRVIGGASGKSAKRRQRRMKRAGFEEVPRLAATTVGGNRLARRWAIAAPYGCMAKWCHAWEVRIATPACALVCNDTGFCQCRASGRTEASAPTHTL